jgi:TonB-linked SusC/RagA family outer membrane protein
MKKKWLHLRGNAGVSKFLGKMKLTIFLLLIAILGSTAAVSYSQYQQGTISGTVTDETGQPLPGVTVIIKGTTQGTVTNANGEYTLINLPDEATLSFSFVGFATKDVEISGQTKIDIVLLEDNLALDEVVVVGYGTMKKSDLTGSVASVDVDKKMEIANTNILQVLQGEMPGVNIGAINRPGESPSLSIRGQNSISAGNNPLIVLDGIIYHGSLTDINVSDVERVDALKDASSTAIYGSRAANGVIIITTKKGTSEKPQFNFNTKQGFNTVARKIPMLNGQQYIQKVLDWRVAAGLEADPSMIENYLVSKEVENLREGNETDWFDKSTRTGYTQEYNLSVSGKSKFTNYYLSGSYIDQEGVAIGDQFNRYTFRINLQNQITSWFNIGVNSSFSSRDYSGIPAAMQQSVYVPPYGRFWENEELGLYDQRPVDQNMATHPLMPLYRDNLSIDNNLFALVSGIIDVPFIPGLKYTLNYSTNYAWGKDFNFYGNRTEIGKTVNGRAERDLYEAKDWTFDNIINYNKTFANEHSVSATLLYSREYRYAGKTLTQGDGFTDHSLGYNKLSLAEIQLIDSQAGEENSVAYMGRLNYKFKDRYMATFTYRRDGFSGFGADRKYGDFPSVALGWIVSEEDFMDDSGIDYLKFRVSYGKNGNQAIGRYSTLARINNEEYLFGDGGSTVFGSYVGGLANKDLGWETTVASNIGLDFGLFKNRLRGDINYYNSTTNDLILNRNLPVMTGFSSIKTNLGEVHNHGVEVALTSANIERSNFSWSSGITFSLNRNEIKSLYGLDLNDDGREDDDLGSRWFIGESLGAIYDYTLNGIYQLDEEIPYNGYSPGMVRIVDIAGLDEEGNLVMVPDGEITPDDRSIIGFNVPNYRFSISNNFSYKNFELYVFINSIQGGGKQNYYIKQNNRMLDPNAWFSDILNLPAEIDYWTPDNPSNTYPVINYKARRDHDFYQDRSFVRLQDVSLSYAFSQNFLNNYNIDNVKLFVSGKNLYTWTKWTGYDPEAGTTLGGFPMLRSYVFGLNIAF